MTSSPMRTRARKPASAVESDAFKTWRQAMPTSAMTALATAGYGQPERAEFLRNIVGLSEDDVHDFSADSYVMPADDDYEAGVRDGATAGASDYDTDTDTVRVASHDSAYDDGYADGYVSGYYCRAYWVHAADIVGYTYSADIYCPDCIVAALPTGDGEVFDGWKLADGVRMSVEDNLNEIAGAFGINRDDESSFDSGDFPKVIFASMAEDAETCGACGGDLI
jgi:hypothetical protein